LILVTRIDHGLELQKMIEGSVFISGSDTTEFRQETIQKMRESKFGVYIATTIFDEGVDIPSVDTVILAAGGKSHVRLLQRIGRGMRHKEGLNQLIIHDFLDDTNMYLLSHSEERIDTYAKEGFQKFIDNDKTTSGNSI
jgi:superfamily II DNA or RNA helicase